MIACVCWLILQGGVSDSKTYGGTNLTVTGPKYSQSADSRVWQDQVNLMVDWSVDVLTVYLMGEIQLVDRVSVRPAMGCLSVACRRPSFIKVYTQY